MDEIYVNALGLVYNLDSALFLCLALSLTILYFASAMNSAGKNLQTSLAIFVLFLCMICSVQSISVSGEKMFALNY
tara:strand:+ start:661 stop:888 length:228 start_codon:yes stop_codon:yes gene_type:complete